MPHTLAIPAQRRRVITHHLTAQRPGGLGDFQPAEYSRFKYGSGAMARKFGEELAATFLASEFFQNYSGPGDDLVLTASPYKYIQPAAASIMHYFIDTVNRVLVSQGKNTVNSVKISRSVLFEGDYGKLTEEARLALLKHDRLTIDRDFVDGKILLVMDDIKITGSHEEKIVRMIRENEVMPRQVVFLYYADLTNPQETGADFEDFLNHYAVRTLDDLRQEIYDPEFILNIRVCKFILSQPIEELGHFFSHVGTNFLRDLLAAIHGDGYYKMASYQTVYQHLLHIEKVAHEQQKHRQQSIFNHR